MTIIHISTDYPDNISSAKTRAISNLVDATADKFDHQVYSLNRINLAPHKAFWRWLNGGLDKGFVHKGISGNISAWEYAAMPMGGFLKSTLQAAGDVIADDIIERGLSPKLVHGHKLSMEAIIAHRVAQRLGIPFGLSLQGNTDRRILSVRRDLHGLYQDIYHGAAVIFPFAPWIKDFADAHLGAANGHIAMLPCMTMNDNMLSPRPSALVGNKAITAFHLRHWHLKNADRLIAAAGKLGAKRAGFGLDIAGGGEAVHHDKISQIIAAKAPENVNLVGPIAGADIQQWMNTASVFVMPSRRETFGLVFVEALMAGCPIIYPKNAAVDGYFNGYNFARAVDASDENAIADIMAEMLDSEAELKNELALWQQSEHAQQFHRANITDIFVKGLNIAIANDG